MKKMKIRTGGTRVLALLLVLTLLVGVLPAAVLATDVSGSYGFAVLASSQTIANKPADGKTTGQPFASGTGGSSKFRIPALITMADGTIVAASDARWNATVDGGGLDTVVSRSDDNGATWKYTFANYLGDNGNKFSYDSTCFIDPALATDGKTLYMLCDLHSYNCSFMAKWDEDRYTLPSTDSGFTADGYLKIAKSESSSYDYYLKDGKIYSTSTGQAVSGYTVDEYFNIYSGSSYVSNLFFSGAPYKAVRTTFLYFTKSEDNGATWSAPMLLPNLKEADESACLVGPGRGIVTADGKTIIYPVYSSTDTFNTGIVYSDDGGATWSRSSSNIAGTSEAAIVELADGTLRVFFRYSTSGGVVKYMDVTRNADGTFVWGEIQSTEKPFTGTCQISAIKYSKKTADGAEIILVSCPSHASSRQNGRIYAFRADTMKCIGSLAVNDGGAAFSYSCLTELADGSIGLLCEPGDGQVEYKHYEISDILGENFVFGTETTPEPDPEPTVPSEPEPTDPEPTDPSEPTTAPTEPTTPELDKIHTDNNVTVTFPNGVKDMTVTAVPEVGGLPSKDFVAYNVLPGEGYTAGQVATVTIPLNAKLQGIADRLLTGFHVESNGEITFIQGTKSADGKSYTFETSFSTVGVVSLAELGDGSNGAPDSNEIPGTPVKTENITLTIGGTWSETLTGYAPFGTYTDDIVDAGWTGTAIPGESTITAVTEIVSGNAYYISDGTNYMTLVDGALSSTTKIEEATAWTFTGDSNDGYTISNGGYFLYMGRTFDWGYSYEYGVSNLTSIKFDVDLTNKRISYSFGWLTTRYWTYSNGIWEGADSASEAGVYDKVVSEDKYSTTVTIKALAVGKTTFTVGNTTYHVTVKEAPEYVTIDISPILTSTTRYRQNAASDDNPAVTGQGGYSCNGTGTFGQFPVTKLSMSKGQLYDLDLDTTKISSDAKWTSGDGNIVTVDENGVVTAVGAGETWVCVTGSDGTSYKIPVAVYDHGNASADVNSKEKKFMDFYIDELTNTSVWWGLLSGETDTTVEASELHQVQLGEVINFVWPKSAAVALNFYAKPDEGYALVYEQVFHTNGRDYSALNGNDPAQTDYLQGYVLDKNLERTKNEAAAGAKQNNLYKGTSSTITSPYCQFYGADGSTPVIGQVQAAMDIGCDAAHGFTLPAGEVNAMWPGTLSYYAKRLPTVDKEVESVNGVPYTEGMVGRAGNTVKFKITVTEYAGSTNLTYSDVQLQDIMTVGGVNVSNIKITDSDGNVIATNGSATISITASEEETKTVYYVEYTVKSGDLDKLIHNTVTLNYTYKSAYSTGNWKTIASAEAKLIVTNFVAPNDIVIDFGLPVTITTDKWSLGANETFNGTGASADYGTVTVTGDNTTGLTIVYTPNGILDQIDTVKMWNLNHPDLVFTFRVIPASTVYYEDDFITVNSGSFSGSEWVPVTDGTVHENPQQAFSWLGSSGHYGYDKVYENGTLFSLGSAKKVTVTRDMENTWTDSSSWPTATFTFTGTGFDVISLTSNTSGLITYDVVNSDGEKIMSKFVTNYYGYDYEDGNWVNATEDNALYQLPVIRVGDLSYGTYTVTITAAYGSFFDGTGNGEYSFWLDGVRVYGTLQDSSIYKDDHEAYPQFIELHDVLCKIQEEGKTYNGALVIASNDPENPTLADYVAKGPNHEVYLEKGDTLSFKLTGEKIDKVMIGMKAVKGNAEFTIGNGEGTPISTATDMYYDITTVAKNGVVTITNTGDNILSLTTVKVTFTEKATVTMEMTEADVQTALMMVRSVFAPVTFTPERLEASWLVSTVRAGQKAILTVKTSEDVEAIVVDGQEITSYRTRKNRSGETWREFNWATTATETTDYAISAVNADGIESDPISVTLTVQAASQRPGLIDWISGILGRLF